MNKRLFILLPVLLAVSACIQTETIDEVLEPQLTLSRQNASIIQGNTLTLEATYTDAMLEDQSQLIEWSSSNNAIVAVTPQGLATGISTGQAWAIATAPGNLSDSVLVNVVADGSAVASVEIQNAPDNLVEGETAQLEALVFNANGSIIEGKNTEWSSSDLAVLNIDPSGLITGVAPGTADVTASADGVASLKVQIQVLPVSGLERSGMFSGNAGYTVNGTATLRQVGNELTLELGADFVSSNGPGLIVYLATTPSGSLNSQNSLQLGGLQSTSGMQSYAIPPGVGLNDFDYAVIYCQPFNIRFGTAGFNQ